MLNQRHVPPLLARFSAPPKNSCKAVTIRCGWLDRRRLGQFRERRTKINILYDLVHYAPFGYAGSNHHQRHMDVSFEWSHLSRTKRVLSHVQPVIRAEDDISIVIAQRRQRRPDLANHLVNSLD